MISLWDKRRKTDDWGKYDSDFTHGGAEDAEKNFITANSAPSVPRCVKSVGTDDRTLGKIPFGLFTAETRSSPSVFLISSSVSSVLLSLEVFAARANFARVEDSRIRIFRAPSPKTPTFRNFFGFLLRAFASLREIFRFLVAALPRCASAVISLRPLGLRSFSPGPRSPVASVYYSGHRSPVPVFLLLTAHRLLLTRITTAKTLSLHPDYERPAARSPSSIATARAKPL